MATVKVNEETYEELNRIAGELRAERGRPVPIDEVIRDLLKRKRPPSDFVGSWKMSDEEEAEIFGSLRELWNTWKPE
jgi:predicted CopG family antitoxin